MRKYINVEAFREEMDNHYPFDKHTQDHDPILNFAKSQIIRLLATFPSADVEPIRHGRWDIIEYEYFTCSECGYDFWNGCDCTAEAKEKLTNGVYPNYCPNCGARMDGKEQEHE